MSQFGFVMPVSRNAGQQIVQASQALQAQRSEHQNVNCRNSVSSFSSLSSLSLLKERLHRNSWRSQQPRPYHQPRLDQLSVRAQHPVWV